MKKLLFTVLFFYAGFIFGQELTATVDRTTVGVNERFQVYFIFEGGSARDVTDFTGPEVTGLSVLGGPNRSTSMQIINGNVSESLTFSYILVGREEGEGTIGSFSVEYKDKIYKTKPLQITVSANALSNNSSGNKSGLSQEEIAKNVFIKAKVNTSNVYRGEQVIVEFKLYTKYSISQPSLVKSPTYDGFWVEKLDEAKQNSTDFEMYNGQRFRTYILDKVALFPTKSGELEITPYVLDIPVIIPGQRQGRSRFDDFFNDSFFGRSETKQYTATSNSLKIKVDPLPLQGQPESFNGVVGSFTFNSSIDKNEVKVNEPVTLKITISGKGNLKLLELPKPELPTGFEVYDPKTSESITRSNNGIAGTKQIEYLIVPRIPGDKKIPPFEFSYFDPSSKKYNTFTTDQYSITVKPGEGGNYQQNAAGYSKEDIKLLNQDIRYIKTSDYDLARISENRLLGSWFWIALFLPVLGLTGFLTIKKRQDKLSGNTELVKFRKAEKQAKNRLKIAKQQLDAGNKTSFYNEISVALNGYLEDKLNIKRSEFSIDKAVSQITSHGIDKELAERVKKVFDKCEFARFAPNTGNFTAETDLYAETVDVIVKLENELSKKKK